jgi:hypothetical protein
MEPESSLLFPHELNTVSYSEPINPPPPIPFPYASYFVITLPSQCKAFERLFSSGLPASTGSTE